MDMDKEDIRRIAEAVVVAFDEKIDHRIDERTKPTRDMALESSRTLKGSNGTIGLVAKHDSVEKNLKFINWLFSIVGGAVIIDVALRVFHLIQVSPLP